MQIPLNEKFTCLEDFKKASKKEVLEYALQVAEKIRDDNLNLDLNVLTEEDADITDCNAYRCLLGWLLYLSGMVSDLLDMSSYLVDAHYISLLGRDKYISIFGMGIEGTLDDRIERIEQEIALAE